MLINNRFFQRRGRDKLPRVDPNLFFSTRRKLGRLWFRKLIRRFLHRYRARQPGLRSNDRANGLAAIICRQ